MLMMVFLLLNGMLIFSSHLIAFHYQRQSSLSSHLLATFITYIAQIMGLIFFLGVIVKDLNQLYLYILTALLTSTTIFILRKNINASLLHIGRTCSDFATFLVRSKDYLLYILLFFFFSQVAATLVKIYYLPPHVGDVLAYHLHPVVEWFQQGKISTLLDSPVFRSNKNPLGAKFLHLWFVSFFKDITWIELPQFLFGLLLSLSVYNVMTTTDIARRTALRYSILVYFIPAVLLQSRTCQDHLILAASTIAALYYFIEIAFNKRYYLIPFLTFLLCFIISLKRHAPLVVGMLFIAFLVSRGFKRSQMVTFIKENWLRLSLSALFLIAWGSYFLTRNKLQIDQLLRFFKLHTIEYLKLFLLPLALLAILMFLWRKISPRLKTLSVFNNRKMLLVVAGSLIVILLGIGTLKYYRMLKPFFVGNTTPVTFMNPQFAKDYPQFNGKLIKNILAFPFRIKDIGLYTSYTPDLLEKSGYGIQFFSFGLVAFLISFFWIFFKKKFRRSAPGYLWIFSVLLLLSYFSIYFTWANYRSFIFFAVIGIILWAFLIKHFDPAPIYRIFIDGLLILMILFNMGTCFFEGNMSPIQWKTLFTINNNDQRTTVKYSSLVQMKGGPGGSWQFIDSFIPPNQPIAFFGGTNAWTFPYFDNRLQRKVYYLKFLPGFSAKMVKKNDTVYRTLRLTETLKQSLRQRGIHYIHLSTQGTSHRQKLFIPEQETELFEITPNLYYYGW